MMRPTTQYRIEALVLAAALASASAAYAEEAPANPAPPAAEQQAENDVETVVSLEDLEALAGGDGVELDVMTAQTLTAINSGNTVTGQTVGSGQISVAGFNGFEGVGNFVLNTGHNNNLQSNMNVSVVLAP